MEKSLFDFRLRGSPPLQPPRGHKLREHLIRNLLSPLLELRHVLLQLLDCHRLQFSGQYLAALVLVVNLLELGVIVLEVGQVDVGNVDVGVSA